MFNFIYISAFVWLGALMQAVTGLGGGLVIVPLLAMVSYDLVPGPMIFASLILSGTMMIRGRHYIDTTNIWILIAGLMAGTLGAAVLIRYVPVNALGLVFGVLILIAVIISIRIPNFHLTASRLIGAGVLSGFMGTSAGIGAPVLALLYQHKPGVTIRATLAFLYFISSLIMLAFLHLAGRFGHDEILSGALLVPGFIVGYLGSGRLVGIIDKGKARGAVLILSSISAVFLILRTIMVQ